MIAATAAVLMALALAGPVAAGQPDRVTEQVVIDETGIDCGGGLTYDLHLEGQITFFDDGESLRAVASLGGSATGSNGYVVGLQHHWTETLDLIDGTLTVTGTGYNSWVISSDVQARDHGRVVVDLGSGIVFEAGSFELLEAAIDPVVLTCEMLAEAAA